MAITMPELDLSSLSNPPFEPMQSPADRVELFKRWAIENKGLQGAVREKFLKVADPLLLIHVVKRQSLSSACIEKAIQSKLEPLP